MSYTPHTPEDVRKALEKIGVAQIGELFEHIPAALRDPELDMSPPMDEVELLAHLRELAQKNEPASTLLGGGVRKHYIPSVVSHLAMQSEFVTSYTPYQPEVAQGILQATFEYQTMMSELTGLPVSNASMYDGATAAAEAALLAIRHTGRERVLVSQGMNPEYREVLETYLLPMGFQVGKLELEDLTTPVAAVGGDVAAVLVQQPNFLGYIEEMEGLARAAREAGALFISVVDPLSLALLKPPGEYGADVAVGDGQSIGNPLSFGGPHFGFMVVREELIRQMPGRLVGETTDVDGRRGYVLTLQAREQHIRRARAKSNICSNHQLMAIMAGIHLSALGPKGLSEAAAASVANAHDLAGALSSAGYEVLTGKRFFNEFVVKLDENAGATSRKLTRRGTSGGIPVPREYGLGEALLLSATELTTGEEISRFVSALNDVAPSARMVAR